MIHSRYNPEDSSTEYYTRGPSTKLADAEVMEADAPDMLREIVVDGLLSSYAKDIEILMEIAAAVAPKTVSIGSDGSMTWNDRLALLRGTIVGSMESVVRDATACIDRTAVKPGKYRDTSDGFIYTVLGVATTPSSPPLVVYTDTDGEMHYTPLYGPGGWMDSDSTSTGQRFVSIPQSSTESGGFMPKAILIKSHGTGD